MEISTCRVRSVNRSSTSSTVASGLSRGNGGIHQNGRMRSAATDVDSYLAAQPDEWRESLDTLRSLCVQHLPGYTEVMKYGMPGYRRHDEVEVGFAKQANYLSLYVLKQPVLDGHREQLAGLDVGKGCIRYRRPAQIDWAVVSALLIETYLSGADIC